MNSRRNDQKIALENLTEQELRAFNYLAPGDYVSATELSGFKGTLEEYKAQWAARLTYADLPGLVEDYKLQLKEDYTRSPVKQPNERGVG